MSTINPRSTAASEQHAALGLVAAEAPSQHTLHPEAQWFPKAGLGLFIHWGLASVAGNHDLSWAMMANTSYDAAALGANKLTPEDYWKLAERFNPDRYDPDKWIAAAARAGMQYAVLTAMHHDGYTLWPSRHAPLGVQSHLGGRDLVEPYVRACQKYGLKVGLYYSPPDWHFDRRYMSFNYRSHDQARFPGRPHFDTRHQPCELPPKPEVHEAEWRRLWHARVEELLTRYGRIDLLWFDGGGHDNVLRDRIRQLQPHIVLNSRSCDGDYDCTECSLPNERFTAWFETCHCWQQSELMGSHGPVDFWGYLKHEKYKPTSWMLESLTRLRAWGGNLLINVGPRPDGELPDIVYERFAETAQWMSHSGASVVGADAGPYPSPSNVPITTRDGGKIWYAHLLPNSPGRIQLSKVNRPSSAKLMRTGETLAFEFDGENLTMIVAGEVRTSLVDVVVMEWN